MMMGKEMVGLRKGREKRREGKRKTAKGVEEWRVESEEWREGESSSSSSSSIIILFRKIEARWVKSSYIFAVSQSASLINAPF